LELSIIRVVAAVIADADGRLLLCKRPAHKRHGNLWEFPGGKIEPGESAMDAARRELVEELGVALAAIGALIYSVPDQGSEFVIEFYDVSIEGTPRCIEHSEIAWLPLEHLTNLPLAPSDRKFAEQYTSTIRG
jgi:8-oxo-dGTP diphosphatase